MNLTTIARRLAPPILLDALRHRRLPPEFSSHAVALAACSKGAYDNDTLAQAVAAYTRRTIEPNGTGLTACTATEARNQLFIEWQAAARTIRRSLYSVIDIGGACGQHYFAARSLTHSPVAVGGWHVVETPAMCTAAAAMADDYLHFHASLSDAIAACPHPDLVFSSGTLQYLPDPLTTLRELCMIGAPAIYLTRIGLVDERQPVYSIQRRRISEGVPLPPGALDAVLSYPCTWLPRADVEAVLSEQYRIVVCIHEDDPLFVTQAHRIRGYGYYAVLR